MTTKIRPLAVNLIILWLIIVPILNITLIIVAAGQSTQPSTLIDEHQTLDPGYYFARGVSVSTASQNSVSLQSTDYVNLYILDSTQYNNLKSGNTFYYDPNSELNVKSAQFSFDLQSGDWYFVVSNPSDTQTVNISLQVNYTGVAQTVAASTPTYPSTSWVGIIALVLYISAIRSLWRMEKNWLWYVYLILLGGIAFNVLSFYLYGINLFGWIDWAVIGQSVGNAVCFYWLYNHRNIFTQVKPKPKTEKEKSKEKNEWKRLVVILLGYVVSFSTVIISSDLGLTLFLISLPVWPVVVWFVLLDS